MMTKVLALSLLGHIRSFVAESSRRTLSGAEVEELAETVTQLAECVMGDEFALRQMEAIEAGLQQEFNRVRPGSNELRQDVILHAHALSGHIVWE